MIKTDNIFQNAQKLIFLLSVLVFALVGSVSATELHLQNGDRITGEVTRRAEGKIYFQSPVLGLLIVNETDAIVIEVPETPVESLAGLPPSIEQVKLKEADPQKPTAKRLVDSKHKWKGKLEFGYQTQSGRSSVLNYSARGEAEKTKGVDNYRFSARYLYGETSDVATTDRQDASFRWRHEMSDRVFGQTLSSYTSDRIKGIDLNVEQNAGLGYKFLQRERQKASIGAGITMQYREADGIEKGLNYLGEFFQDYTYKLNGRLTFLQDFNALYSPNGRARSITASAATGLSLNDEAENFKIRFNSTLQGKLSERISLNLRYEYEYDNAILDKNERADRRVTSSLGYSF